MSGILVVIIDAGVSVESEAGRAGSYSVLFLSILQTLSWLLSKGGDIMLAGIYDAFEPYF